MHVRPYLHVHTTGHSVTSGRTHSISGRTCLFTAFCIYCFYDIMVCMLSFCCIRHGKTDMKSKCYTGISKGAFRTQKGLGLSLRGVRSLKPFPVHAVWRLHYSPVGSTWTFCTLYELRAQQCRGRQITRHSGEPRFAPTASFTNSRREK